MGKKCIPGVFCIENMTLFVLSIVFILLIYAFYRLSKMKMAGAGAGAGAGSPTPAQTIIINNGGGGGGAGAVEFDNGVPPQNILAGISLPPLLGAGSMALLPFPTARVSSLPAVIPINIETRPSSGYTYSQIGMLSRTDRNDILPLMGRRLTRDKWQYYTVSNTHLNVKLPILINGKNAGSEYGCNELSSGDSVYVEGYGDGFVANIYENTRLSYL
jgi:hypothetical protein